MPLSGLLGVMSMAVMVQLRTPQLVGQDLSQKFSKLWMAAEPILFVLVGAAVDISYAASAGIGVIAMIFLALAFRVLELLLHDWHNAYQKGTAVLHVAYLPKATVQAAHRIGSAGDGAGLWAAGANGGGGSDPDYCPLGGGGYGVYL